MVTDPTRMCELLVGLPDVIVLGVVDHVGGPLEIHVRSSGLDRACIGCGQPGRIKERDRVALTDLPCFGRPTILVWHKTRLGCHQPGCAVTSWTLIDDRIAPPRMELTTRAGRWVTEQVGRYSRTVNDVAAELGCDWHTINDAVVAYGEVLVDDDPNRIGSTTAVGLDETLFVRRGPFRAKSWATSIVDVAGRRLLDIVPGQGGAEPCKWFTKRGADWCAQIRWATLDMSGPFKAVFDTMLPDATQIADPFHVVKLANERLDDVRRRVQQATTGHRGRKGDALYRIRKLLVMAEERVIELGKADRLRGLLDAADPKGEVRDAWHAKELVRGIYFEPDHPTAVAYVTELARDLQDHACPPEVRQLGRTLKRWLTQITNWHLAHLSNGPAEAANNLIKRVKRGGFGFTNFRNYRTRVLLYAGRPNWALLPTITPR